MSEKGKKGAFVLEKQGVGLVSISGIEFVNRFVTPNNDGEFFVDMMKRLKIGDRIKISFERKENE